MESKYEPYLRHYRNKDGSIIDGEPYKDSKLIVQDGMVCIDSKIDGNQFSLFEGRIISDDAVDEGDSVLEDEYYDIGGVSIMEGATTYKSRRKRRGKLAFPDIVGYPPQEPEQSFDEHKGDISFIEGMIETWQKIRY